MTDLTESGAIGFARGYNDADFARAFSGVPLNNLSESAGIGFGRTYNDADFARSPGAAGDGFLAVTGAFTGTVTCTIEEIDGFDVIIEAYGVVTNTIGEPQFTIERLDVDDMDIPINETGRIEFTWA